MALLELDSIIFGASYMVDSTMDTGNEKEPTSGFSVEDEGDGIFSDSTVGLKEETLSTILSFFF